VANLSLLGYDPRSCYSGRGPLEAASLGVDLAPGDVAFRCNLVTILEGVMADYAGGQIETAEARQFLAELQRLDGPAFTFHTGIGYRHLLVHHGLPPGDLRCTPPHDLSGRAVAGHRPRGPGADLIQAVEDRAGKILSRSRHNEPRLARGAPPITHIWLWGQGGAIALPTLRERFGLEGSVISAVALVRGLGKLAGLTVRTVAGATGYLGTDDAGKIAAARQALAGEDFVYLHIEAPDETSHEGDIAKKIQAIEEFDRHVVGPALGFRDTWPEMRILVSPDHPTLISTMTHDGAAVPFALAGPGVERDAVTADAETRANREVQERGPGLFARFLDS
jgi:2,3-bisphosphoglycerate-independent phosphoglycerate mutase